MKSESYRIVNENVKISACLRIKDIAPDGKTEIVIRSAGSKSAAQRGLQWKWYTEIAKSGIGGEHEDTKEGVHLISKYRWAIPILIRDNSFFADLHSVWIQLYGKDKERMRFFIDSQAHTESFTVSQMAEFLTEMQNYYTGKGVKLTDPDDLKLLMYKEIN